MKMFPFKGLLFFAISALIKNATAQNLSLEVQEANKSMTAEASPMPTSAGETKAIIEKWEAFDRSNKRLVNEGIKMILPIVMQRFEKSNVSSTCVRNALRFIAGLKESKVWAFSLIDASGKAVDGLLTGSMASLGEYDQCINTVAINERKGKAYGQVIFRGQYCALDIRPPLPPKKQFYKMDEVIDELKDFSKRRTFAGEVAKSAHFFHFLALRIGICVPSGCSKDDISSIVGNIAQRSVWKITVKRCEVKVKPKITPIMMFVGVVYGFFALLLVLGTTIDVVYHYRGQKVHGTGPKVLTSFSFVSNFQRLTDTTSSVEVLRCLNGVKVLSITWVILGHTYMNINFQIFRGLKTVSMYQRSFEFQAIINTSLAVDSFFFTGGLLVCYLMMKIVKEMKKPFSLTTYVLHRLWRIMPLYVLIIIFMFLGPVLGSGPIWHDTVDYHINACYKNWWTNLVFLNNFIDTENICLFHSWYIASDMQLYLFSLIILLPLIRWPKVGIALAVLCTVLSMFISSLVTYLNNFPPTMLFVHPDLEQRVKYVATLYYKPYPHAGPYFIGILVGYLFATKPKIRFSRMVQILGWCAAIVCNLSSLYGVWEWNSGRDPNLWETMFYSGCHRTAWALGLAWVVVCCATGQGGVVHYILTWKAWIPINRLTYAVYLIHPIIQITVVGTLRMKLQPSHDFAVWMYFGHLMVSYGSALVLSMLIEAPALKLEKIFLQRWEPRVKPTSNKTFVSGTVLASDYTKKPTDINEASMWNGTQNNEFSRL